jgi:hypothetical protein
MDDTSARRCVEMEVNENGLRECGERNDTAEA